MDIKSDFIEGMFSLIGRFYLMSLVCLSCSLLLGCGSTVSSNSTSSEQKSQQVASSPKPDQHKVHQDTHQKAQKLTLKAIHQVMVSQSKAFQQCYQSELKKQPTLKGMVKVQITISGSRGKVLGAKLTKTTIHNQAVEGCVLNVTKKLQFPSTHKKGPIRIAYPFSFKPN